MFSVTAGAREHTKDKKLPIIRTWMDSAKKWKQHHNLTKKHDCKCQEKHDVRISFTK